MLNKMFEQENYTKFSWVSRKVSNEGRSAKAMFTARKILKILCQKPPKKRNQCIPWQLRLFLENKKR